MENLSDREKKYILIVEDDDALRKLYTFILQQENYEVKACANIVSFILSQNTKRPDIIIMDLGLPDGNGLDLCQMVKTNPKTSQIPVLILSGKNDLAQHTQHCKADAIMTKPFDLEEFLTQIALMAKDQSQHDYNRLQ